MSPEGTVGLRPVTERQDQPAVPTMRALRGATTFDVDERDHVCERTVDFMSIYPTLTDLAGIATPAHVEGKSIRTLLADPSAIKNVTMSGCGSVSCTS